MATPVTPTVTCDSNGTYTITPDNNLSDGSKTFTVSQTDSAGNTSPTSAVTPSCTSYSRYHTTNSTNS